MNSFLSIVLSVLMLLSSSGITYAQHFCGPIEMMAKITLGEQQLSCGMAELHNKGCDSEKAEDHNCCDNEYTQVDTDDNFTVASFDFELPPVFVAAFVSVFILQDVSIYDAHIDFYKDYSPPPLGEDLQVLYASFLI